LDSIGSFVGKRPQSVEEALDEDDDTDNALVEFSERRPTRRLPTPNQKTSDYNKLHFPNDAFWQRCLRHFAVLPPVQNEGSTKRKVRIYIWGTLILDLIVGVVSISTFGDSVTMCCRKAIMASSVSLNWNLLMKIISYLYMIGIILEIYPVVRAGPIPWNLLNPIFAFFLSLAVFVDDSKAEAISIWILESASVVLEFLTYINLKKLYKKEEQRIEKLSKNIRSERNCLKDKSDTEKGKPKEFRKMALKRERRNLRIDHSFNAKKLQYHFVGVTVNFCLVCVTLLIIILVARGGGMCYVEGEGLNLFNSDQRARCSMCAGDESNNWESKCQICKGPNDDASESGDPSEYDPIQCYYPYF
jgi:hypothetical protein